MLEFTLDTNCLIDVDEGRPAAKSVKRILRAAKDRIVDVAMVASSASERQKDGRFLTSLEQFELRRRELGFDHVPMLLPLLRWDVGFWDSGLWVSEATAAREKLIYRILFPASPIEWTCYAAQKAVQSEDVDSPAYRRWRNQILDAQAYWSHDFKDRDVFVTSDLGFQKLRYSADFANACILVPYEAAELI